MPHIAIGRYVYGNKSFYRTCCVWIKRFRQNGSNLISYQNHLMNSTVCRLINHHSIWAFVRSNINNSSSNTQRDYQIFVNQRSIYQMSDDFLFKNFHRSFSILSNIWKFKTLVNLCVLYIVHCNVHTLRFLGNLRGFTLSESQRQHLSHFCWNF